VLGGREAALDKAARVDNLSYTAGRAGSRSRRRQAMA